MRSNYGATILSLPFLLPLCLQTMAALDCKHLKDKVSWDLSALGGQHMLSNSSLTGSGKTEKLTFVFDICGPLKRSKEERQGCKSGTWICAEQRFVEGDDDDKEDKKIPDDSWPIAGDYTMGSGKPLDEKVERLRDSGSNEDAQREGLRIYMNGGERLTETEKRPQKAIFTMICDPDTDGTGDQSTRLKRDDDDDDNGRNDDDDHGSKNGKVCNGPDLCLVSYKSEGDRNTDVLRVEWRSKHACEKRDDTPDDGDKDKDDGDDKDGEGEKKKKKSGWGWFTWFIIIVFLGIAAYLIFGSWLNYNRHGARGWDLLPHGDTIRDLPYLLKDWGRQIVGSVQGRGSRDLGYIRV